MKMMQLTDQLLNEHYAHLANKPFFQRIKNSMMAAPVICCCYEGVDAVETVRSMTVLGLMSPSPIKHSVPVSTRCPGDRRRPPFPSA